MGEERQQCPRSALTKPQQGGSCGLVPSSCHSFFLLQDPYVCTAVWYTCSLSPFAMNTKQMLHLLRGAPSLLSVSCSSFHKSTHLLKPFLRPHLHVSCSYPFFFTGFSFSLCIYIDVHRLNLVLLPAVPSWFGCLLMGPAWSPAGTYTQETDTMRIWESHGGQAVTGGEDDEGPQHFPQKQQIIWIFPRWSLPLYF